MEKSGGQTKTINQRLVLCLDGTWNRDDGKSITNIVKIRDSIEPMGADGVPQNIYYELGVGTGLTDRILGGAFGVGLGHKVRAAYRHLSAHYRADDRSTTEIYIFGFSRGAYTARALAGFLGSAGLLRPEHCNAENEERVWQFYRTKPNDRMPADRIAFEPMLFPNVRIRCLAVFDTVGALGIPLTVFRRFNHAKYAFYDTELGSNVDVALQALAVDEKRTAFWPAVWARPPHVPNEFVAQVWFPGVHSNVGGGYKDSRLSSIALEWMMSCIRSHSPEFAFKPPSLGSQAEEFAEGTIYESRKPIAAYWYDYIRPAFRKIRNLAPHRRGYYVVGLPPHGVVLNEYLHWTCLLRWRKSAGASRFARYTPANLKLAIDRVKQTYLPDEVTVDAGPSLLVVGENGEVLSPDNESAKSQVSQWIFGNAAGSALN